MLVACEGVPALLQFEVPSKDTKIATDVDILPLSGNVLDVAAFDDFIIVSVDNIHLPGSTLTIDESTVGNISLLIEVSINGLIGV